MADDEETSWVFDSLVGFLKGPVWNIPILTFIEQKSVVFEPGEDNDEEYKKIHEEYKNLVDFMLGSHMDDLGITPEQFEKTCSKSSGNIHSQFHQSLFEQVWAADDYEIFKRMMTQKNIELQLQALEILAQRFGLVPESMVPDADSGYLISQDEEKIMEEVIKKSLEEHEREKEMDEEETKQMEQAIQATLAEKSRLEAERLKEKEMLDKAMKEALLEPSEKDEEQEEEEAPHQPLQPTVVDPEEIKRRQGYLREQRDRLLALKRQEREKQLALYQEENTAQKRPKSARAAQQAIHQNGQTAPEIDSKTLAFRKSLAARLKAEVVGV